MSAMRSAGKRDDVGASHIRRKCYNEQYRFTKCIQLRARAMAKLPSIRIAIPEQGIDLTATPDKVIEFFRLELEFYNQNQAILDEALIFLNNNYGNVGVHRRAANTIDRIIAGISNSDFAPLKAYIASACQLRIVVGQGKIGQAASKLIADGQKFEAKWILLVFSAEWSERLKEQLAPFHATVSGNPVLLGFSDLVSTSQAKRDASAAKESSDANTAALL
jgi:hypothetical protein